MCGKEIVSAFRELEPLAGTGLTGLFAFFHARIACQQAFLLERYAERLVDLDGNGWKDIVVAGKSGTHILWNDGK